MSVDLLELGAAVLGDLADEVVFVGGATVSLWITDPGAPPPRPTKDVDVIVEVATRADYHAFEERLRGAGFRDDGQIICRWRHPIRIGSSSARHRPQTPHPWPDGANP